MTNFPNTPPSIPKPTGTQFISTGHAEAHTNAAQEIEAIGALFQLSWPVYIQNTAPAPATVPAKYVWIQTGLGALGTDVKVWLNY